MKKQTIWIITILLTLSVLASSCRKKQHFETLKERIAFNYLGGTDVFNITADCNWSITCETEADWFTISPESGNSGSTMVVVTAERNTSGYDREAMITVISADGKDKRNIAVVQNWVDITAIESRLWFLRYYSRWDTDYYNHVIPESNREYYYATVEDQHNWYLYFVDDTLGYEVHIYPQESEDKRDTILHPFEYIYYPIGDSLLISFETVEEDTVEDYHATINELNEEYFNFTNEYLWHRFERLDMVNLSNERVKININPAKVVKRKGGGPLIQF